MDNKEKRELVSKLLAQLSDKAATVRIASALGEALMIVANDVADSDSATEKILQQMEGVDETFILGVVTGMSFSLNNAATARAIKKGAAEIAKAGDEYVN